ncbi:MAG: PEP-CTERM sorting domain-containing protein [Verrucomicrobiales bacterium]
MKKALIALAATLVALSASAQGLVLFDTLAVDFQVRGPGNVAPGSGITAQLFQVGAGGALTPLTPATTFLGTDVPEAARVYTVPVEVAVPGVAPGVAANLVFRAYEGSSFETASVKGETAPFSVILGGGLLPAANLDALTGQSLTLVPEPSTIALGVLGAAALLFRRRK